jgi:hypothetical protein
MALDAYSVAARLALDDGSVSRPVTLATPPPLNPTGSYRAARDSSRKRYGRERATVEARLRSRAEGRRKATAAPIGRKKRQSP